MRYGAWYLNTKLWKKQRADEPLVDPKVSCKAQEENFKKELQEQVCVYAEIWSSWAKDYRSVTATSYWSQSLWNNRGS